ncbi:PREDICTED: uncharacterized protein LOC106811782 [Priapulus caudatus]|uniref:Uncharacterized protein LOC106811782 n=1 Tax=Priapulus caudatus TaxID=37621 RepID=A0ABM1EFL4_PRICU|nr:PREDICTED: uncharacterized protein LOC106811782 [Priapulus caudatus]
MSIVRRTSTMSGFRVEHAVKRYLTCWPFQDTRHLLIILIVATLTLLPCGAADECQNEVDVSAARWRVTPLDGSAAGNYTKLNGASDLARCRDACCVLPACNVILLYNEDCYLIACASDAGCEQMPRDDDRFERSAMLAVRPVGKQSATGRYGGRDSPVTADDDDDDYEDVDLGPHDDCDPGAPASCPRGEVCRRRLVGYYVCECPAGTVREFTSRECVDKLGMGADVQAKNDDTQPHTELWKPVVCLFGIDACMPHESCVTNRRARNGVCQCDDGFVREDSTGDCLAPRTNKPPVAVITPKKQTVKLPTSETILDGSHMQLRLYRFKLVVTYSLSFITTSKWFDLRARLRREQKARTMTPS